MHAISTGYIWPCLFYCTELLIFHGHQFLLQRCSSLNFNPRGVYNFITKKANIPVKLVSFFNDVSFLFCRFLKSGVTNELKSLCLLKRKKVRVIYSKQGKTLLLIKCQFGQDRYGGPLQLQPQAFLARIIHFRSVERTTIYIFLTLCCLRVNFPPPDRMTSPLRTPGLTGLSIVQWKKTWNI